MAGPMLGMLQQLGGAMFGAQVGQGLGQLALEVVSGTDIGLPLAPKGVAVLLPANITAFGAGLSVPQDDVRLYVALREAAHHRLYGHVAWLEARLLGAVEEYAGGINVDGSRLQELLGGLDPGDPAALQQALESGVFEPEDTPAQAAALARLETLLALVEGWVDMVVTRASKQIPGADVAARGRTPSPGHRRPRRADVRDPGRPRAAPTPAPRGGPALGAARGAPRHRRTRRRLGAPRPPAGPGRPRRPGRLRPRRQRRDRVGHVGAGPAGRQVTADHDPLTDDAVRLLEAWAPSEPGQERLRTEFLQHLATVPEAVHRERATRPPHRVGAGAERGPHPRPARPASQGPALAAVRWAPRTGRPLGRRRGAARGEGGERDRRPAAARSAARSGWTAILHPVAPGSPATTSTCSGSRWPHQARCPGRARSRWTSPGGTSTPCRRPTTASGGWSLPRSPRWASPLSRAQGRRTTQCRRTRSRSGSGSSGSSSGVSWPSAQATPSRKARARARSG